MTLMNKEMYLVLIAFLIIFSDGSAGQEDNTNESIDIEHVMPSFGLVVHPERLTGRQWSMIAASGALCALGAVCFLLSQDSLDLVVASHVTFWTSTTTSSLTWIGATFYNSYRDYQRKKAIKLKEEASV